jgi:ketosteroid isomerase-like protein
MKVTALLTLSMLIVLSGAAAAQGQSADEKAVRDLDNQERIAALNKDTKALERLWSEQFVGNQPNNRVVADKKALIAALVPRSSYVRNIEFFRIDGDFAFLMGLEIIVAATDAPGVGLAAGKPTQRRFTNVWKREGNTWRLYARHANVIPERQ